MKIKFFSLFVTSWAMSCPNPFVIVGGGISGITCAEQLASELPSADILLISASPQIKAVTNVKKFSEMLEEFDVEEKPSGLLEEKYSNIRVIVDTVSNLNAADHEILLQSGKTINYNKICLCTGGIPRIISKSSPFVMGIRDTHTIEMFQKKLNGANRVVIVGNGGIATELVYEIKGCELVWAIRDKYIGSTFFDPGAAEFFLPHLKKSAEESSEQRFIKRLKYTVERKIGEKHTEGQECPGSALGPDWSTNVVLEGQKKHEPSNVNVQYNCEVEGVYMAEEISLMSQEEQSRFKADNKEWPVYVKLSNKSIFGCDFVISATGVNPNTEPFLQGNEFKVAPDGGLEVNDQMQTSEKDVFAAGDVCCPSWQWSKHWLQMRLWTQAKQMGAFAGKCIAANHLGHMPVPLDICFDLFTHVTRFFGFKVILLGLFNGQKLGSDCEILLRMTKGEEYVKVILQNGRMQGAILIGETDLEEVFENLILNELDLTRYGEDLLNPNIDIEDYFD